MEVIGYLVLTFVVTFLLGSIPWGVIISKLAYHKDLRNEGSGNIGTTNAMRALGKTGGAAVFVLDFGKGLLAGWLAVWVIAPLVAALPAELFVTGDGLYAAFATPALNAVTLVAALAFAGCTLGHVFSPWLGWHGGKGVAVAAACLVFVFGFVGFLLEVTAFALGILFTRCVSVGSLAAAVLCPILALYYYGAGGHWAAWLIIAATAGVVIWAHRENIARLKAGTENKIGSKKK